MDVSVQFDKDPNAYYTPDDVVRGAVILNVSKPINLKRIAVSLEGKISVNWKSGRPGFPQSENVETTTKCCSHQLFHTSLQLFPPQGLPREERGYGLTSGKHSLAFGIVFPVLSDCGEPHEGVSHTETTLPSSLRISTPSFELETSYVFRVSTLQPKLLSTKSTVMETKLNFVFSDPPAHDTLLASPSRRVTGVLPLECEDSPVSPSSSTGSKADLPDYTPALFMDATIPNNGNLYSQEQLPLELRLTMTRSFMESRRRVTLRRLKIYLVNNVTGAINGRKIAVRTDTRLLDKKPNLNIDFDSDDLHNLHKYIIDQSYWENCVIPAVPPTTICCGFTTFYALAIELLLEYNEGAKSSSKSIRTEVGVRISNELKPPTCRHPPTSAGSRIYEATCTEHPGHHERRRDSGAALCLCSPDCSDTRTTPPGKLERPPPYA